MSGTSSYSLKYLFQCDINSIFEALTDVRAIQRYTCQPAKSEPKVGGIYETFDGSIVGEWKEVSHEKLVLDWKLKNWEAYSTLEISFSKVEEGETFVKVVHSKIPHYDKFGNAAQDKLAQDGMRNRIFLAIKQRLGLSYDEDD